MPIYEYQCGTCGERFEELIFSQEGAPDCPKCGTKECERLISACTVKTESETNTQGFSTMPPMGGGCSSGG